MTRAAVWRPLRRIATLAAVVVALSVLPVLLYGGYLLAIAASEPDYDGRKGELVEVQLRASHELDDSRIEELRLRSSSGVTFDIALRIPHDPLPGRPLIVLLAGNETGHQAATLIRDPAGATVAALSYPFEEIPYRDWLPLLRALPDIQRGILDTPSAVLLALDYLLGREDLALRHVELVGVSFGAYLVAVPAALDPRVDRLWLVHGSGAPAEVIAYGLEGRLPLDALCDPLGRFLAAIAGAAHLTPERWVQRVPPRPLVVINAADDESLPATAVRRLHEALPAGTEVLWTPGDHVHPKRPEIMDRLSDMIRERVLAITAAAS
jgi:pimeloyl-ACP methyl ester carboxylesterase